MKKFLTRVFTTLVSAVTLMVACAGCFEPAPPTPPAPMFENLGVFETLQNFTVIDNPDSRYPQYRQEYGEYYFTEYAYRVYTPYREQVTQRDAYYHFDATEGYTCYRQNESTDWYVNTVSPLQYKQVRNETLEILMMFVNEDTVASLVMDSNSFTMSDYNCEYGGYTHHFSNILFTLDSNGNILNGSWTYKAGLNGQYSVDHAFTLTAGNTQLTLPELPAEPQA